MERLTIKHFQDALKKFQIEQQEVSETVEPIFHECGLQDRPYSDADMEPGVFYCTSEYHFIMKNNYRYCSGPCPIPEHKRQVAQVQKIKSEYLTLEGQPMEFATFIRDAHPEAFDKCVEFSDNGGKGKLILAGGAGRGKTHLARSMYISLISKMHVARWIKAPDLAELFRRVQSFSVNQQDRDEASGRYELLKRAECVFLDDLGTERQTESDLFNEQFKLFLEDVRSAGLVVTTNLDSKDIFRRYQDKIASRLLENCKTLVLLGEDYRRKSFPRVKA